jgi:hypothetical protein
MHTNIIRDDTTVQRVYSLVNDAHAAAARHPDSDYLRARVARIDAVVCRQRASMHDMQIVLLEAQRQRPGEDVRTLTMQIDRLREEMRDLLLASVEFERQAEGV